MSTPHSQTPHAGERTIIWNGRYFPIPYLIRDGGGGPSILFVHGLGGAKENFQSAFESPALADCKLVTFDEPGTGLALFDPNAGLNVTALADIAHALAERLLPEPYFLAGASMGGLINLLQLRNHGIGRILGLINLEGNLCSEDCMFSRRVIPHPLQTFDPIYRTMMAELRASNSKGDQLIAENMATNVDIRAYHTYSFETVAESDSGRLLPEFLNLPIPRLFLYGDANKTLSYLPTLRSSSVQVREIPSSGHFVFYDNPPATFNAIGEFVHAIRPASIEKTGKK
jgi:pimeloyl-ACP methyl ester carboxylesterase